MVRFVLQGRFRRKHFELGGGRRPQGTPAEADIVRFYFKIHLNT